MHAVARMGMAGHGAMRAFRLGMANPVLALLLGLTLSSLAPSPTTTTTTASAFVVSPTSFRRYPSHRTVDHGLPHKEPATAFAMTSPLTDKDDDDDDDDNAGGMPQKVAVTGATGRTGRLVVQELLGRQIPVVAVVRTMDKAGEVFGADQRNPLLQIVPCDLTNESQIFRAVQDCDAAIWCATGFSDAPTSWLEQMKRVLGIALAPKQSIDSVGVPLLAKAMLRPRSVDRRKQQRPSSPTPQVVMLSSAGVTRPSWDDSKKEKYQGCADIPIVRLNPFGILNVKAESEEKLRQSGVHYCVVRPTGLNDNWPAGSRPLFSQGDVAVGRINRQDVAKVLCDVLTISEACGKTFEVMGLAGYPPARDIRPALARLVTDGDGLSEIQVEGNFALLQQLLPGEVQDAAQLAMGQTYEELDQGKTGRLGQRGMENPETVLAISD